MEKFSLRQSKASSTPTACFSTSDTIKELVAEKANTHCSNKELDAALAHCATMTEILQKHCNNNLSFKILHAETCFRMGLICEAQDNLEPAIDHYCECLKIFQSCRTHATLLGRNKERLQLTVKMVQVLTRAGEVQMKRKQWTFALDLLRCALNSLKTCPLEAKNEDLLILRNRVLTNMNVIRKEADNAPPRNDSEGEGEAIFSYMYEKVDCTLNFIVTPCLWMSRWVSETFLCYTPTVYKFLDEMIFGDKYSSSCTTAVAKAGMDV